MEEMNIKELFKYFKKYVLVFFAILLMSLGGVFIYDKFMKQPAYRAQTSVMIAKSGVNDSASGTVNDINASLKLVSVYGEIVKSEAVLESVNDSIDSRMSVSELSSRISTKASSDTATLTITAESNSANDSALIANKVAEASMNEMKKLYKVGSITQLSVASVPTTSSNNTLTRDLVIAAILVVFGVFGFAFLKFYFDKTIRYNENTEKALGASIAGTIPEASVKARRSGSTTIEKYSTVAVSESFKILRANLQFAVASKRFKTLLVTSANVGEGKTFVAANLAMAFAQAGKKVLLVDTDLRSGNLHKLFDISNEKGLAEYLAGNGRDFDRYIEEVKNKDLFVMPCGKHPTNPSELLSSRKCKELIKSLSDIYDIVIFDGAPVNGYADSIVMASYADETLMVVKDASTKDDDFKAAENALEKVGAKITGVVMNRVESTPKYKIN